MVTGVHTDRLEEGSGDRPSAWTWHPDGDALADKVQAFVTAYNQRDAFLDTQRVAAGNGDAASIGRDPVLRQLKNDLRDKLTGSHGSGTLTRLAEIGIEFTRDGRLKLDRAVFDDAVATNGAEVRQLLAGAGGAFRPSKTCSTATRTPPGFSKAPKTGSLGRSRSWMAKFCPCKLVSRFNEKCSNASSPRRTRPCRG